MANPVGRPRKLVKIETATDWHFQYFYEQGMDRYRVWKTNWYSDQFEVMTPDEFQTFKDSLASFNLGIFSTFTIQLEEVFD